jgi:hypothetical protein
MHIKRYIQTLTSVVIEFENLRDTTDYRDYLRDHGIYAEMPQNEKYILKVTSESLMEGFIKDNVIPHMGD